MRDELFLKLSGGLQAVFGPMERSDELPELVRDCKSLLVAWLYPAISLGKRKETRRAVCCLFPLMGNVPVDAPLNDLDEDPPPTFPQAATMFRLWAMLASREFRAVVRALRENNLSCLDSFIRAELLPVGDRDAARRRFVELMISQIYSAHEDMLRREGAAPVKIMTRPEMAGIAEQIQKRNPSAPYYVEATHLHIRINPEHDVESIVEAVRKICKDHHAAMSEEHRKNWNDVEREIWGDDFIGALDPVKEFTYKEPGSKSRNVEKFLDESFHALLVYELRQALKPVEIERRFFGMKESNYYSAMRDNTGHNVRAERLIRNAFAGLPLHLKI